MTDSTDALRSKYEGVFTPGKFASSFALVWTKYIVDFLMFGAVRFHTALFASEPYIVNKTACVLRSSINMTEILKQGKQEVQKQANYGDIS